LAVSLFGNSTSAVKNPSLYPVMTPVFSPFGVSTIIEVLFLTSLVIKFTTEVFLLTWLILPIRPFSLTMASPIFTLSLLPKLIVSSLNQYNLFLVITLANFNSYPSYFSLFSFFKLSFSFSSSLLYAVNVSCSIFSFFKFSFSFLYSLYFRYFRLD